MSASSRRAEGSGTGADRARRGRCLEAALAALGRGWSVVPLHSPGTDGCSCGRGDCPSPGKHPRVRWERYQQHPPEVGEVRGWWSRWPDANLGVVTGPVSGLVVLDVDPRHGGDERLTELEESYAALPPTVEVVTGGGGRHRYLRHPGAPVPSGPLATGIDIKGDGGLVVAPPSRHASGGLYRWEPGHGPDDSALAALPAWLLDLASHADRDRSGTGGARDGPPPDDADRLEFAELWATVGVFIRPGDHYHRCPFHPDEHPSLHVDAEGARWYCFGCGRGGGLGRLRRLVDARRLRDSGAPAAATDERTPVTLPKGPDVEVVGESRHQETLLELTGGRRRRDGVDLDVVAELVPAPLPDDPDRVEVRIAGRTVGELEPAAAHRCRGAIEEAVARRGRATCEGSIRGGWDRGRGDVGRFGVTLRFASGEQP